MGGFAGYRGPAPSQGHYSYQSAPQHYSGYTSYGSRSVPQGYQYTAPQHTYVSQQQHYSGLGTQHSNQDHSNYTYQRVNGYPQHYISSQNSVHTTQGQTQSDQNRFRLERLSNGYGQNRNYTYLDANSYRQSQHGNGSGGTHTWTGNGDHHNGNGDHHNGDGDWRDGHHNLNGSGHNGWNDGDGDDYRVHRYGNHHDHWRSGYYQYSPYWNDGSFFFSAYTYTPYDNCVVSPWYAYPTLPPYLSYDRVTVLGGTYCPWNSGTYYNYNPGYNPESYGNPDVNFAIDEISRAFNTGGDADLSRVIPQDGRVNIYNEGQYMYSVNGGDFYNMIQDNIHGVRTRGYVVTSVRMEGADAIVTARHDYYNPWNGVSEAYQMFRLRPTSDSGYIITDFMTSSTPVGGSSVFGG